MIIAILYVVCVLAADILAARWIVSLPFGLFVPAGVFAIAPVFTVRDQVHERWGRRGAYILIGIASVMSWALSIVTGSTLLARVTLASVAAFALNEVLDTEVYAMLRARSRFGAILGSNAVSAAVDSVLFIWVAFGPDWRLMLGQYLVKLILAGAIGWIITRRDSTLPLIRAT
jgi:uncharacterized PurR-regulated membrane protein YhhQ (DUF165 family)